VHQLGRHQELVATVSVDVLDESQKVKTVDEIKK
jgi:hypothetical protein